jgi:hypothetical protein
MSKASSVRNPAEVGSADTVRNRAKVGFVDGNAVRSSAPKVVTREINLRSEDLDSLEFQIEGFCPRRLWYGMILIVMRL